MHEELEPIWFKPWWGKASSNEWQDYTSRDGKRVVDSWNCELTAAVAISEYHRFPDTALMKIGYARVSTASQDVGSQGEVIKRLGIEEAGIYVDHGATGTNRARLGLGKALAAVRTGDTLVVTKLDRLAQSIRDAADIGVELDETGVQLSRGNVTYDPHYAELGLTQTGGVSTRRHSCKRSLSSCT